MIRAFARSAWLAAAILVLVVALRAYDGTPNSDAHELLGWAMLALSFPAGLLYAGVFAAVSDLLWYSSTIAIPTSYLTMSMDWLALALLGYLQWFVGVPRVIRKLRTWRSGSGRTP